MTARAVLAALIAGTIVMGQEPVPASSSAPAARDDAAAEQLGWRLGVQAWTFRDRTAFEAIDAARSLGLKYIELFPGQALAKEHGDVKVGLGMTTGQRAALTGRLAAAGIRVTNFGVVDIPKQEAEARKMFEFAKALGIESLTCEPALDAWDTVEKLCDEYAINAACHDHPKPSAYWNPQTVLKCVQGRSKRLGACADTGHWPRSGLDAVDCLRQLEGRIVSLHFKDIAPADKTGEDKPWGTGAANARAMLDELHRQDFRGVFSIEYETGAGAELEADVRKCIAFFDRVAGELVAADGKGVQPAK